MAKLAANVYGEALFEVASQEVGAMDTLWTQAEFIRNTIHANPALDQLLAHPGITKAQKQDMMREVFHESIGAVMEGFLYIVIAKERYAHLSAMLDVFITKIKEAKKIGTALVTTPLPLSEEQKAQLMKRLLATTSFEKIHIEYALDPSLIGGIVIRMKDRVVDASVKTRLGNLTKQLMDIQIA
ncbi:MAG: ATP synthase F1 subunit delta [Clostridium sp.]|jgi:F-type H+-transporting ATPase subunit delta|nr:ATP synthase F1 subunit delta [Clostridium sp.]